MKLVFLVGGPLILMTFAFLGGLLVSMRRTVAEHLKEIGFTRSGAKNYRRAMKLLNRMTRITELDGDFSMDTLSEPTKKEIGEILATYRKELETQ